MDEDRDVHALEHEAKSPSVPTPPGSQQASGSGATAGKASEHTLGLPPAAHEARSMEKVLGAPVAVSTPAEAPEDELARGAANAREHSK
jgi:hypothetical protein